MTFENQDDVDKLIAAAKNAGYSLRIHGVIATGRKDGCRASSFNFEPLVPPSLPSVAEVIAKQFVMILAHLGGDCSWVGKNTGFRVDLHPLTVQDVLKEIITAALALHEQREREKQTMSPAQQMDASLKPFEHCGQSESAAILPDIGQEIAEKAVKASEFSSGTVVIATLSSELGVESFGTTASPQRVTSVLASLINQGVARGAMEQWEKDDTIVRATPVTIGHERLTKNSMIVALAATEPEGK